LAGAVPHRGVAAADALKGASFGEMLANPCKALITFNIEPEYDAVDGVEALAAVKRADFVVAISSYVTDNIKSYADVILPLAMFTETSGTYVNAEGVWQSFKGASLAVGESRPGWKILRVMGNLLDLDGFDYISSEEVKDELKQQCQDIQLNNSVECTQPVQITKTSGLQRIGDVPLYAVDALVRRATQLQKTTDAQQNAVRINSKQAVVSGVADADKVKVKQGDVHSYLRLIIDEAIPDDCVWISAAMHDTLSLGPVFGSIELEKV
jgi:NADH-quinone oxidoreductase subunit G